MKKRFAITVLALALTAGSAMTSFAAGFTGTGKGVKYQWGDGAYCTNNWVQYGIMRLIPENFRVVL